MERRHTMAASCHIEDRADGGQTAIGYAAVFYRAGDSGTEYELFGNIVERIDPGAFDDALERGDDVRGLFNHDPNNLLGRTSAGTARLSVDDRGLRYEIDLPDTQVGRDVAASLRRGDLTGSSFTFIAERTAWSEEASGRDVRSIESVRLLDVGPVTYPAYESTTSALRCGDDGQEAIMSRDNWRAEQLARRRRQIVKQARKKLLDT